MAQPAPAQSAQPSVAQPEQLGPGTAQLAQLSLAASAHPPGSAQSSSLSLSLSPAEFQQPQQPQPPGATDRSVEALKAGYPEVDWDALMVSGQQAADARITLTVAEYVVQRMWRIWGFIRDAGIPGMIVPMAQAGMADKHMPYPLQRLQPVLPGVPPLHLEEFVSWQAEAQFGPKQHMVLERDDTVPFKLIRQAGGQHAGFVGSVSKVKEGKQVFARKEGTEEHLTPELDVLEELPKLPHNVHLRASYEQNQRMHLIITPWADIDLGMFLECDEQLPVWTSASKQQKDAMLVNWMHCLAVGLADLHCRGIKHKDIRPCKLLLAAVSDQGTEVHPVFCDFGLSKHCSQQPQSADQGDTLCYRAPEQLAGRPASRKADVFSLGCILLELAMFAAGKSRNKLKKLLQQGSFASSPSITEGAFADALPSDNDWWVGMKSLLQSMLSKEQHQRPHAEEVASTIHDLAVAAGYVLHCHRQPEEQRPHRRAHVSPSPSGSASDSDSSYDERLF